MKNYKRGELGRELASSVARCNDHGDWPNDVTVAVDDIINSRVSEILSKLAEDLKQENVEPGDASGRALNTLSSKLKALSGELGS